MKRSNLFLLELILDLALFVLCGAVCVGLFLHAGAMSRESQRLTQAVALAQSTAEALRADELPPQAPQGYQILSQVEEKEDGLCRASVEIRWEDSVVYTLETQWVGYGEEADRP